MSVFRDQERFPTRNYPNRDRSTGRPARTATIGDAAAPPGAPGASGTPGPAVELAAAANTLYRHVLGLDTQPRPMTPEELALLDDPFGRLLRSGEPFPLSLRALIAAIDALAGTEQALPDQLVFLVADGGHIAWTPDTDQLQRAFRFAIARGGGEFPLLISGSTALDAVDDDAFLQVLAWDNTHEVFHYYQRLAGTFFWAGMSTHALEDTTRGMGPFDSHVNGSLVMKELRAPWIHWHAPQAGIDVNALAPGDPLRGEPLFLSRVTAERLETLVVRPGIKRWNAVRIRKAVDSDGVWRQVPRFLRQVVTETTVNLATSDTASHLLEHDSPLRPPLSFFLNRDVLFDGLGFEPDDPGIADIRIPGKLYLDCLQRYEVYRTDGVMRIPGDVHFAFLTPEAAFEDTHLVEAMIQAQLLTRRLAACIAMTDFTNPIGSRRRAALLRYVPDEVSGANPAGELERLFVENVQAAVDTNANGAGGPDRPEREFLENWNTPSFETAFIERISEYFVALQSGMADADVVDGWFRLAEHRRRRFRRRPLAEFKLTTPHTNIPDAAPPLRMTPEGRVEPVI